MTPEEIEAAVERVLRRVLPELASQAATPRYATADNNPLGSSRAFLDAGRRGDFETFRCARRVTALWTDVEAWIERRKKRPAAEPPITHAEVDALLADMKDRRRGRRPKESS